MRYKPWFKWTQRAYLEGMRRAMAVVEEKAWSHGNPHFEHGPEFRTMQAALAIAEDMKKYREEEGMTP